MIKAVAQVRSPFTDLPTLFIYDNYPEELVLVRKFLSYVLKS